MRALISVYDKSGIDEFARGLHELGWELVASGGTAAFLEEQGLPVTRVERLTGFAEMLGHRVVTLHPAVHGGILARRDIPEDMADLEAQGIEAFDLVAVNLYPFIEVASRRGVTEEEAVEMIDIGGPALLRGAAKNFAHVAPVARPERYGDVLTELRARGELSLDTRRSLAQETFVVTAAYESAIAQWFGDREAFPQGLIPTFWKDRNLAYGENPHQRAAYYAEAGARRHLLSRVEQLNGRELSFNNLNDLSAARGLVGGVHAARLRDRQAREPVRGGGRGGDRGRVPAGARLRSGVGVRRHRRPQPAGLDRARGTAGGAVHRGAVRARVRGRRARRAAPQGGAADPRLDRASERIRGRAGLPAGARRPARAGPGRRRRGPGGDDRRLRRAGRGRLGRSALRVAGVQARHLERDRDREEPAHDRDRRRAR